MLHHLHYYEGKINKVFSLRNFFVFIAQNIFPHLVQKSLRPNWCVYEGKVNFTYVNKKRSRVLMCTTLGLLQRGLKYIDTFEAEEMPVIRESKQTDSC